MTKEYAEGRRVAFAEASLDAEKVAIQAFIKCDDAAAIALRDFSRYLRERSENCTE